jgi:hypothetical protein
VVGCDGGPATGSPTRARRFGMDYAKMPRPYLPSGWYYLGDHLCLAAMGRRSTSTDISATPRPTPSKAAASSRATPAFRNSLSPINPIQVRARPAGRATLAYASAGRPGIKYCINRLESSLKWQARQRPCRRPFRLGHGYAASGSRCFVSIQPDPAGRRIAGTNRAPCRHLLLGAR